MSRHALATAATLLLALVPAVHAAPRFRVVDLGFLPGTNGAGTLRFAPGRSVVGGCTTPNGLGSRAARWTYTTAGDAAGVDDLGGLPGFDGSAARGANATGWVVGFSNTAEPQPRAVLWRGGQILDLDDGRDGNANLYANDVNDTGQICGFLTKSGGGGGWDAAVWTEQPNHPGRFDRVFLPYPPIADPAVSWTEAHTISESGRVFGRTNMGLLGDRALFWEADAARTPVLLEPLAGSQQSMPGAMNESGDAVGYTMYPFGLEVATRWSNDAAHTPVALPSWPGDNGARASGIDPTGASVVGESFLVDPAPFPPALLAHRTVLWTAGSIWDLQQQLDASGDGWTLMSADDVDADGRICGLAKRAGLTHPVLLVPVPDVTGAPAPAVPGLSLAPPAPNPSRGEVSLAFTLPSAGHARVRVLDAHGRRVANLLESERSPGRHAVTWSGRGGDGRPVAPGIYLVVLETDRGRAVTRLARVR